MSSVASPKHRFWHHPSRLLLAEESVAAMVIVASGLLYLFACLPQPILPPAAAEKIQHVKASLARRPDVNAGLSLMAASRPMLQAVRHARRLEDRGLFDSTTRAAWQKASDEFRKLAAMPIATADGSTVRLWMREGEEERAAALEAWLEELLPGRFAALQQRREAAVAADPSLDEVLPAVTWDDVAAEAPDYARELATNLCRLRQDALDTAALVAKYRDVVGYDHWKAVCAAGATEMGLRAHAAMWRANFDLATAQFTLAREAYEEGFRAWRAVCEDSPGLRSDPLVLQEMKEHLERYRGVLSSLPDPTAKPVVLQDVIGDSGSLTL